MVQPDVGGFWNVRLVGEAGAISVTGQAVISGCTVTVRNTNTGVTGSAQVTVTVNADGSFDTYVTGAPAEVLKIAANEDIVEIYATNAGGQGTSLMRCVAIGDLNDSRAFPPAYAGIEVSDVVVALGQYRGSLPDTPDADVNHSSGGGTQVSDVVNILGLYRNDGNLP